MKIIIVGFGKVGYVLAEQLNNEGHDLTVIDSTASAFGRDNNLPLLLFGLNDPENIYRAVNGDKIGTMVSLG